MCNRQQQATEPAPPTKEIPRGPFTHTAHTRACMHSRVNKHTHRHTRTCKHNGSIAYLCFSPTRPRGLQGVAHRTAGNIADERPFGAAVEQTTSLTRGAGASGRARCCLPNRARLARCRSVPFPCEHCTRPRTSWVTLAAMDSCRFAVRRCMRHQVVLHGTPVACSMLQARRAPIMLLRCAAQRNARPRLQSGAYPLICCCFGMRTTQAAYACACVRFVWTLMRTHKVSRDPTTQPAGHPWRRACIPDRLPNRTGHRAVSDPTQL